MIPARRAVCSSRPPLGQLSVAPGLASRAVLRPITRVLDSGSQVGTGSARSRELPAKERTGIRGYASEARSR